MHRLVARAIRDRLRVAGELNASIAHTLSGLTELLVDEEHAWQQRHAGTEAVAHAVDLSDHITTATERDPQTRQALVDYVSLANGPSATSAPRPSSPARSISAPRRLRPASGCSAPTTPTR